MTKQELEQYRSIVAEIDEVREKIRNNTVSDTVVGSSRHYPFTSHVMRVEGISDQQAAERDKMLLDKLNTQKQEIEEFVNSISDSLIRRAIYFKYINGEHKLTWKQTAHKLYPKIGYDKIEGIGESLRKRVSRFFKYT